MPTVLQPIDCDGHGGIAQGDPDLSTTELVIFDCDGVLADSEVISAQVLVHALAKYGVTIDATHVYRHFVGQSFPKVAEKIRATFQLDLPAEFEAAYRASLVEAFTHGLAVTSGLHKVLARLAVRACVATSSSPPRVARTLALCDLAGVFGDNVFTASQVRSGKPDPDLFLFAAEKMGVAPENCLVIEDSLAGVFAAQAAGMTVWRYVGGSHFAGFDVNDIQTPSGVPVFDNWDQFYSMAPGLQAREGGDGEV